MTESTLTTKAGVTVKFFVKVVMIPLGDLIVQWPNAQRPLINKWVDDIVDDFDSQLFDVIKVSLPLPGTKGKRHVIDGWHRCSAGRKLGWPLEKKVPCFVYQADDEATCAALFHHFNNERREPTALNKFITAVAGEFEEQVAINKVVESVGLRVENRDTPNCVRAVKALTVTYRRVQGDGLRLVLKLIRETWPRDGNALSSTIINGYGVFVSKYGNVAMHKRVVSQMTKQFTPGSLEANARHRSRIMRQSSGSAVADIVRDTYNLNLRHGRLGEDGPPANTGPTLVKTRAA